MGFPPLFLCDDFFLRNSSSLGPEQGSYLTAFPCRRCVCYADVTQQPHAQQWHTWFPSSQKYSWSPPHRPSRWGKKSVNFFHLKISSCAWENSLKKLCRNQFVSTHKKKKSTYAYFWVRMQEAKLLILLLHSPMAEEQCPSLSHRQRSLGERERDHSREEQLDTKPSPGCLGQHYRVITSTPVVAHTFPLHDANTTESLTKQHRGAVTSPK